MSWFTQFFFSVGGLNSKGDYSTPHYTSIPPSHPNQLMMSEKNEWKEKSFQNGLRELKNLKPYIKSLTMRFASRIVKNWGIMFYHESSRLEQRGVGKRGRGWWLNIIVFYWGILGFHSYW